MKGLDWEPAPWMGRAKCAEEVAAARLMSQSKARYVADQWFPVDRAETTPDAERRRRGYAAQVCAGCPVIAECLRFALADPSLDGIWGSTTPKQRSDLRAKRAARRAA